MDDKAVIIYLGHSAWAVDKGENLFIFDYDKPAAPSGKLLGDGVVCLDEMREKKVFFFASHRHFDHFNLALHQATEKYPNITFVTGGFECPFSNNRPMHPRQSLVFDDIGITVYTGASTDEGVCFLVATPGLNLFHSGDNAEWGDDSPVSFLEEIHYIAGLGLPIDAAFIPVCTFSGQRPQPMTAGALEAIRILQPRTVFPMHGNRREALYRAFAGDAAKAGVKMPVVCMEKPGDSYLL